MIVAAMILATIILATGCASAPEPTPQIVTVVETVPVEVTRMVEVLNTVEVTRQVVVTVVVEVPVTPQATPTATQAPAQPAATFSYLPSPTALGQAFETPKAEGVSRLKLDNESDETLRIQISGPQNYELEIPDGKSAFLNVPYGEYTIRVFNGSDRLYTVRVNVVNPDKYEVNLGGSKATVMTP